MERLIDSLKQLNSRFESALAHVSNRNELDQLIIQFLGKKGELTELFQQIKILTVEAKKELVPELNRVKERIELSCEQKKNQFFAEQIAREQSRVKGFDVTAYQPVNGHAGHLHPYTEFIEEIENIFISMGYDVWDGPLAETDYYNFTALNLPEDHPARDMYDTLWLNQPNWLLRTHTSNVQVKMMESKKLPLAGISSGRVFRHEAVDASHDIMFMQCEGLFIDKNITLAHLFGVAKTFLQTLFQKKDLDIRIRPGFFPFVEPGVEIDMKCPFCKNGCSVCKKSCWIEVFPGGMVHPNVLRMSGIDPEIYSGFAFGFGLTRLAMIRYGIPDIRLLHSGKLPFLKQF